MNKSDLVTSLAELECIPTKRCAAEVVEGFFGAIVGGLEKSERVELRGLGSFTMKDYDGFLGRNPKTGDPVSVPPKRLPKFTVSQSLVSQLNSEGK